MVDNKLECWGNKYRETSFEPSVIVQKGGNKTPDKGLTVECTPSSLFPTRGDVGQAQLETPSDPEAGQGYTLGNSRFLRAFVRRSVLRKRMQTM